MEVVSAVANPGLGALPRTCPWEGRRTPGVNGLARAARAEADAYPSVPGEGFEPSRGFPRRILSAVRLPFRHPGGVPHRKCSVGEAGASRGRARPRKPVRVAVAAGVRLLDTWRIHGQAERKKGRVDPL